MQSISHSHKMALISVGFYCLYWKSGRLGGWLGEKRKRELSGRLGGMAWREEEERTIRPSWGNGLERRGRENYPAVLGEWLGEKRKRELSGRLGGMAWREEEERTIRPSWGNGLERRGRENFYVHTLLTSVWKKLNQRVDIPGSGLHGPNIGKNGREFFSFCLALTFNARGGRETEKLIIVPFGKSFVSHPHVGCGAVCFLLSLCMLVAMQLHVLGSNTFLILFICRYYLCD